MGELARFLSEIRRDPDIKRVLFDTSFLDSVGRTLEKRGFEETRLFLWDSHSREDLEKQAIALLGILGKMEGVDTLRKNRVISSHIIRNIHRMLK